ncbi:hypothetical protein KZO60_05625 [Prevotella nanceiensis]|uniref:hypothetical protein n=1 Tax=Hoylesella nanceiensis TaxID=425941 RepID=UPI001C5E5AEA|nr:hypothetical protein [Hoylesella nanceiensis]MBW4767195.1 hypothetical protein [Hoylesella nanceiensis]
MDYLNIFFPYMSAEQIKVMEETPKANEDLPEFNQEINEVVSTLFPPDEVTGNPTNAVSKLLSPNVSAMEKEKYASTMQAMPKSEKDNRQVDDATLIAMTPSRYNSTNVDNEHFGNYVAGKLVENANEATETNSGSSESSES